VPTDSAATKGDKKMTTEMIDGMTILTDEDGNIWADGELVAWGVTA
tara:strand:+ start:778 stop:915 length:138 start_codon:yes stop_codon:yes gene_type:complete